MKTQELPTFARLRASGQAIFAAEGEGDDKKRRTAIQLYTGAEIARWGSKLIFDVAGMSMPEGQLPILFAHDMQKPIGFADKVDLSDAVEVEGTLLSPENVGPSVADAIQTVLGASEQGLQFQASMGVRIEKFKRLSADEEEQVNGRTFSGPGFVVTRSTLREASILTVGADQDAKSTVLELEGPLAAALQETEDMSDLDAKLAAAREEASKAARAELKSYLEQFKGREAFATECFADGLSVQEAKAKLADVLLAEQGQNEEKIKDMEARLSATATMGAEEGQTFTASEEVDGYDSLTEQLSELEPGNKADLSEATELLKTEYAKLGRRERKILRQVSGSRGNPAKTYAAIRMAESAGRSWIDYNPSADPKNRRGKPARKGA